MVTWQWQRFADLSADEVYEVLSLRQEVFVVEQHCPYRDADGRDRDAWHLTGKDPGGELVAYLRLLPPKPPDEASLIGRVVVRRTRRREGLGRHLMEVGIQKAAELYPGKPLRVAAQHYLVAFYTSLGFATTGKMYDEDGIAHIAMVRHA